MGARGNSGVILSQIVRGAAEELATRPGELIDPILVVSAFARAADAAYESVRDPAEGTMLTVIRAMAHAAAQHLARMPAEEQRLDPDAEGRRQEQVVAEVIEVMTRAGEAAVQKTTGQLEQSERAGVVDAGAHGLVLILAGALMGLRGEETPHVEVAEQAPARLSVPEHSSSRYRYCVNFIVTGEGLDGPAMIPPLETLGDSVLVVGDEQTLKVHVHTDEPPAARALFEGIGEIQQVDEADMREQVAEREARLAMTGTRTGVLAVVSGEGITALYRDLGATVIDGGETMNPSTDDLLAGIHAVPAESVLVLPNSPNVVLAAQHAAELAQRDARVLDCTAPQAGLGALVEFDAAADPETNERSARRRAGRDASGRRRAGRPRRRRGPLHPRRRGRVLRRRDRRLGWGRVDLARDARDARRRRRAPDRRRRPRRPDRPRGGCGARARRDRRRSPQGRSARLLVAARRSVIAIRWGGI